MKYGMNFPTIPLLASPSSSCKCNTHIHIQCHNLLHILWIIILIKGLTLNSNCSKLLAKQWHLACTGYFEPPSTNSHINRNLHRFHCNIWSASHRVQTPGYNGYIPKKPGGFFWVDPPKKLPIKPTPKKPSQLKSDFVLCATNKEAKHFIILNALSPWILSLYFCNYSKLLVQTLKQATNVQIKDKAPFFSPKSVRK